MSVWMLTKQIVSPYLQWGTLLFRVLMLTLFSAVTKKARKNTLQREKPFLNKKTKKRNLLRRTSDMFSVSSSPELKSDPKASKAASSTLRLAKTDKSANSAAVPSCLNLKTKNKKKEKESKAVEKRKRLRAAPPEKAGKEGDEGQGFTQSDSPLREDQLDATGKSLSQGYRDHGSKPGLVTC